MIVKYKCIEMVKKNKWVHELCEVVKPKRDIVALVKAILTAFRSQNSIVNHWTT